MKDLLIKTTVFAFISNVLALIAGKSDLDLYWGALKALISIAFM